MSDDQSLSEKKDQQAAEKIAAVATKHQGKSPMDFLKSMVTEYARAQAEYRAKKTESDIADYVVKGLKDIVIQAFQEANEDKIVVKDVGTCYVSKAFKARVPQSQDQKLALYQYIADKYGEDRLEDMRSINYQSLNSWLSEEAKALEVEKKDLKVPGIEAIELELNIGLRKS